MVNANQTSRLVACTMHTASGIAIGNISIIITDQATGVINALHTPDCISVINSTIVVVAYQTAGIVIARYTACGVTVGDVTANMASIAVIVVADKAASFFIASYTTCRVTVGDSTILLPSNQTTRSVVTCNTARRITVSNGTSDIVMPDKSSNHFFTINNPGSKAIRNSCIFVMPYKTTRIIVAA